MKTMLDKVAVAGDITQALDRRGVATVAITVIGGTESTAVKLQSCETADGSFTDFKELIPASDATAAGTGAAGGLGFALLSYLNASMELGIDLVMKETGLEQHILDADLVVTGEGRLDGQSYMGKTPIGVAKLAKKYNKPVIAFSGCVTDDAIGCNEHGIDAFFPILRKICTLDEAMDRENACRNLQKTVAQAFRLIKIMKGD